MVYWCGNYLCGYVCTWIWCVYISNKCVTQNFMRKISNIIYIYDRFFLLLWENCFVFTTTDAPFMCRCGRFPPEVRTAIPVENRFEHVVLSCSTTSDHAIAWIERESEKALQVYKHYITCCWFNLAICDNCPFSENFVPYCDIFRGTGASRSFWIFFCHRSKCNLRTTSVAVCL
jgi:hypothetical protein